MTAPFLSLAQIRNRLILTARWVLRHHRPEPDGRCPICRVADCGVAAVARDVLRSAGEVQLWGPATGSIPPGPDDPQRAR